MTRKSKGFAAAAVALTLVSTPGCLTAGYLSSISADKPAVVFAMPVILPLALTGDVIFSVGAVALCPLLLPLALIALPGLRGWGNCGC